MSDMEQVLVYAGLALAIICIVSAAVLIVILVIAAIKMMIHELF